MPEQDKNVEARRRYWRANLLIVAVLLTIWFCVSCLAGILIVDKLNGISLGGFKLGFWFAQQGSIYVFIVLILVYALLMDREDKIFHVEEDSEGQHDVQEDA